MDYMKLISSFFVCLMLLTSCQQTDIYYEKLVAQPELINNYATVYTVGDTLEVRGRFYNREALKVKIGDAYARIISIENKQYPFGNQGSTPSDTLQYIKLLIAADMGIGPDRPVTVSASGIDMEGNSIEILEDSKSGLLNGELTVLKIADYPAGTTPVFCQSGTGNLYFIHNSTWAVSRMTPDGQLEEVFNTGLLQDNDGIPFTVTELNGTGIDGNERYLYLSFYTQATGQELEHFYRLVRYDLHTGEMRILNKTPYHRLKSRRTLAAAQPFEGNIGAVKIYKANAIYPDKQGNVFFQAGGFITKLDAAGHYSYIFKPSDALSSGGIPEILNPETGEYYSGMGRLRFFPGVYWSTSSLTISAINPDAAEWYIVKSSKDFEHLGKLFMHRIDLNNQVEINAFSGTGENRYISGSFNILTGFLQGGTGSTNMNGAWGRLPIGEGKIVVLWYQDSTSPSFPVWGIIDYEEERGYRYAPGVFSPKGYRMTAEDKLLNYDADSMLYMTANNRSVILKTVYK